MIHKGQYGEFAKADWEHRNAFKNGMRDFEGWPVWRRINNRGNGEQIEAEYHKTKRYSRSINLQLKASRYTLPFWEEDIPDEVINKRLRINRRLCQQEDQRP